MSDRIHYGNVVRMIKPSYALLSRDEDNEYDKDLFDFDYINEYRKYFNLDPNRVGVLVYDYYFDKTSNSLIWEVDVVGYKESDIEVTYSESRIIINVKNPEDKESESREYFNKGIILDGGELKFEIDINRFDVSNTSVTLENGILKVVVPTNASFVNNLSFKINSSNS